MRRKRLVEWVFFLIESMKEDEESSRLQSFARSNGQEGDTFERCVCSCPAYFNESFLPKLVGKK